jgi:hypothetical protein
MPANAIVLDANLLVLFAVGTASRSYIARHKRLRAYTERDFVLLCDMLATASRIIVTPNTVTETSNLVRQIQEPARSHISKVLGALLTVADEIYVESKQAAEHTAFPRLGVTDAVLLNILTENHVLLTSDLDLYLEAVRNGPAAMNFTHYIAANG